MHQIIDAIKVLKELGAEYAKMPQTSELITKLRELNAEIDAILDKGIEEFLGAFNSDKPLFIHIEGCTPLWNDGEPCTHYVDYYIGIDNILWDERNYTAGDLYKEWIEGFDELECSYNYDTKVSTCEGFDTSLYAGEPENVEELKEVMDTLVIPALDKKYGTDYRVLIVIHNGKLTIKYENYNPEW